MINAAVINQYRLVLKNIYATAFALDELTRQANRAHPGTALALPMWDGREMFLVYQRIATITASLQKCGRLVFW